MIIGVPKEIKTHEYRVGLTPTAVREYVALGHEVIIETEAGNGIGAHDDEYKRVGARIAGSAVEVFSEAEMIVKVKEPQSSEWKQLREGQILFTYLHLAADPEQARGLAESGCSAIAYETVTDSRGGLPLLAPMSAVAGRLAVEAAATALRRHAGGRGVLLGGVPGVRPARIVVIGGGVVGTHAARMAIGLGAETIIIDRSIDRLRELDDLFEGRARTVYASLDNLDAETADADVIIGAVLIAGASAPKLIRRDQLKLLRPGAVLVDVAIDQGGCFETSRPTTHENPTYEVDGVIHYCVANMPGAVPLTSSHALNNATLPFGLALASKGLGALQVDAHLRNGLNVHNGKIMHPAVTASLRPVLDERLLAAA
ncbi:MAG: alanine dehydrogenase [Pseudorhodoplanes sp.]|nr:alanine dehydrogenase [Pseudorhodoplanes sp.]